MKRYAILSIVLLLVGMLHAQETFHFRTSHPQGITVESSTANRLKLHYSLSEISIADIDNGEAKGQEIVWDGHFAPNAEGLPNLPFENRYIAVPRNATVRIEAKENTTQTLDGIDLLPAAPIQTNTAVGLPRLQKDMDVYGKDACFPTENITIAQTTQIRGLDVALLNITPFRYNPIRKTLEIIYEMDIDISFEGGDGQFVDARYLNPDWDRMLRDLVINSDMIPEADYYHLLNETVEKGQEGCEYLIIAPDDDDIMAWADTLKTFRTQQGILTKVVTTSECGGNTTEQIKGYIKNAYDNWAIPPAAVMIFNGLIDTLISSWPLPELYEEGTYGIPGFPLVFLNYNDQGENHNYKSDNPYADMNGDSIPDLALSRLPAMTLGEYKTQVEKLIQYETDPPTDPHYYDQPIITSGHEDNKWFMITSQSVNGFFRNKLGKHPHNFYMLYEYSTTVIPDSAWSTGYNTAAPFNYFGPDGQGYIPRYIGELDDWRSMEDNSYFVDALNSGSFLTLYRDHCATDWWCCPVFDQMLIDWLTSPSPTFVLSIGCNTGKYTYSFHNVGFSSPSILNSFCNSKVGALGGIGATTVTHSQFNDILTWGIVDYIWPEFLPTMGSATEPQFVRPSYALVAGKLFLEQHAFLPGWWPVKITDTHNVFHYLGEAYLNLYTEVPRHMDVSVPMTYASGQAPFIVKAEQGAVISLSKDGRLIKVETATGQDQPFVIPEMPSGERFHVTVTKQNCFRFDQDVISIVANEPYVFTKEAIVKNPSGTGHLQANAVTSIDLVLSNGNNIASESAQVTLSSTSPYVEILKGTADYPRIAPNGTVTLKNAFKVSISSDIADQSYHVFQIHFNEGHNTHSDSFTVIADAPVITIDPEFNINDGQGEPSTHIAYEGKTTLTFHVTNTGHSESGLISAQLCVKAPFVTVSDDSNYFGTLTPGEQKDIALEVTTDGSEQQPAWLQAQLDLQYGREHLLKDTLLQYGGIFENFETDTLNPYFKWTNNGSHKWTYCDITPYEGMRCFMSNADTVSYSRLRASLRDHYVGHQCKISFRFKTDANETLTYNSSSYGINGTGFSSEEWQYAEVLYSASDTHFNWNYRPDHPEGGQAFLDDICFPPMHRAIAYAGDDQVHCGTEPITLHSAYAYDCESVFWTTGGDGEFDENTKINPTYSIGQSDWANGNVILTLHAITGNDTIVSTTTVSFADEILMGNITGDTIVNLNDSPISHYRIAAQEGAICRWELEPTSAGIVYGQGNEVDVVWNLYGSEHQAFLSVTSENGCETTPVILPITLEGVAVPSWEAPVFKLFPNPTDGKVFLTMEEPLQGNAVVEVFNLSGERMVMKNVATLPKGGTLSLDLSRLSPGLYIVKLSTERGSFSSKVSLR